jgi:hypothetical protein
MQEYGQTFVFFITVALFGLVLWLVRQREITERYAVLWVAISLALLTTSSLGYRYLFRFAELVGIPYPPSALFLLAIFGLTLLVMQLFASTSRLNERSRVLVQQVALLENELEEVSARTRELEALLKK